MNKHAHRPSRRTVFATVILGLGVALTGNAYATTKRPTVGSADMRTSNEAISAGDIASTRTRARNYSAVPRQSVTKQIQLVSGSPASTLFNVPGVARIQVTCTADQSSTGAIRNGLNVAVVNTGRVDLPLVFFRASERPQPQFARPSGATVIPGGAATELFSLDDGIDNAHTLQVETVANRRLRLDLAALTKHTPTGGCLVTATLTTG